MHTNSTPQFNQKIFSPNPKQEHSMVGEEKRNSSPSSEYQHPLMQEIKTERFTNFEQTNIVQLT